MDKARCDQLASALLDLLRQRAPSEDRTDRERLSFWLEGIALEIERDAAKVPIPLLLWCPMCGARHIDEAEFATKVHHTHSCQGCGLTWRPAIGPTVGVQFLPGFKNEVPRG